MSKKFFTPLENLNYKLTRVRNHKFLTGFIFLIIFNFLFFNFPEKVESVSPKNPNSASNNSSVGSFSWSNPANVFTSNNSYASAYFSISSQISYYLTAYNFSFGIPSNSVINGIVVDVERKSDKASGIRDYSVKLFKDVVTGGVGENKADTTNPWLTTDATKTYGTPTDLWGTTWTPANINSLNFGVGISARSYTGEVYAYIDHIQITVYYSPTITISGTIYSNEGTTPYDCSANNLTVRAKVNGLGDYTGTCTASNGAYSFSVAVNNPGDVITVFLDDETPKAVTVTKIVDTTSAIPNLNLYQNRLILRHEDSGPITNADLALCDKDGPCSDSDIFFYSNGSPPNLGVDSGKKIVIWAGKTFAPGGNVTTPAMRVAGTYSGGTETLTLNGVGTSATCTDAAGTVRPLCIDSGGNFTAPTYTLFNSTGNVYVQGATSYKNLILYGAAGTVFTATGAITVDNDFIVTNFNCAAASIFTFQLGGAISVTGTTDINPLAPASVCQAIFDTTSNNYSFTTGALRIRTGGTLKANGSSLDANGNVTIASNGTLNSTSGNFNVAGNWSNSGTFTHNSGTVIFDDDSKTSTISGSTTFYNLTSTTPSKNLIFTALTTQTIAAGGTLTLNGQNCFTPIVLRSTITGDPANRWNIDVSNIPAASRNLRFVRVGDSNAIVGATGNIIADNSYNSGNNVNWTINLGTCVGIKVSGNAYEDEGTNAWSGCDGSTARVSLVVNGGAVNKTTSCRASDGYYEFTGVLINPNSPVSVFFNSLNKGVAVTVAANASSDISLNPRKNIVWVKTETGVSQITNSNLDHCDSGLPVQCVNVPYSVSGGNLTIESIAKLIIESNKSFVPGGSVTLNPGAVQSDPGGDVLISSGATFGATTYAVFVGGDWLNQGDFSKSPGQTTTFTATGTGFSITPGTGSFGNIVFNGIGGGWSFTAATNINDDFTIIQGSVIAPATTLTVGGKWSNSGTFSHNYGTVIFNAIAGKTINPGPSNFYNIQFNGSGSWSFTAAAVVENNFTITQGSVTAPATTLTVKGNWSNSGTFNHSNGTVIFDDATKSTILSGSTTFYNLTSNTPSKDLYFEAGKTQNIVGTLTIQGGDCAMIALRKTGAGAQWTINVSNPQTISYVYVKDGNASGNTITVDYYTDAGNNTGWTWGTPLSAPPLPNVSGYAWSENIGWISFNSQNCDSDLDCFSDVGGSCPTNGTRMTRYGVHICINESDSLCLKWGIPAPMTGKLAGFAWSENIGWIDFAPDPDPTYPEAPNYSACFNLSGVTGEVCEGDLAENQVGGWARALAYDGGWDGWIKLRGTTTVGDPYGVWIDTTVPSPYEFKEWAWGSDIVGWISFNCQNCEGATCDSYPACGDPNHPNYKVVTSLASSVNQPPYVESPQITGEDYCQNSPTGQISIQWTYQDDDGDHQSYYNLQVATDQNFNDIILDYTSTIIQDKAPGEKGSSAISVKISPTPGQPEIPYTGVSATRYWRVRVKASTGNPTSSDWSDADPSDPDKDPVIFQIPPHPYPYVDFEYRPESPSIMETTYFCSVADSLNCDGVPCSPPADPITCYDNFGAVACYEICDNGIDDDGDTLVDCADPYCAGDPACLTPGAEICDNGIDDDGDTLVDCADPDCTGDSACLLPGEANSWYWEFFGATLGTSAHKNLTNQFVASGQRKVTLQVCDSTPAPEGPYCCTKTRYVPVELPLPKWKEIPPTF